MSKTLIIARRELSSFFCSPIAYVVTCLFTLLAGLFFMLTTFQTGFPAELRSTFYYLVWVLIGFAPAISMRLVADELRTGTIETLMTAPVSDTQVVVGKFLGAWAFYLCMLAPTLVFVALLAAFAQPDYGPIATGYVGLVLVGGLYLAIGTFASVLTRNQIIAFLIAVCIIVLFTVVTYFVYDEVGPRYIRLIQYLNINLQFEDFSKGVLDLRRVVFFFSGIVLFLSLGVKMLESRKWR